VGFGWTGTDQGNSGVTIAFDPIASSAPSSALTALVGDDAGSCRYARLQRTFADAVTVVHYGFDVRLGNAAGTGGAPQNALIAAIIAKPKSGGQCQFLLGSDTSGADLQLQVTGADGGDLPGFDEGLTVYPLLGKFSRVQIDVDFKLGTAMVRVDGTTALGATPLPSACSGPTNVNIQIGPFCAHQAMEYRFDNVTYTGL
jgi:hypothetical protein